MKKNYSSRDLLLLALIPGSHSSPKQNTLPANGHRRFDHLQSKPFARSRERIIDLEKGLNRVIFLTYQPRSTAHLSIFQV